MSKSNIVANRGKFTDIIEAGEGEFTEDVTLANDKSLVGTNYAGTETIPIAGVTEDNEILVGGTLIVGPLEGPIDGGLIALFNMPVSSDPSAGDEMSATIKIGDDNILKIYAEADGAGGIQNPLVKVYDAAGTAHDISYTDGFYAEMYLDGNANVTTIETADTPIMVRNAVTGEVNNFTFNAGSTGAITAYSDGTGKVNVASTAHGLISGDCISIRGTTNYNGIWEVTKIDDNNFSIPDTWVANDGASDWDEGSHLIAGAGAAGNYAMTYNWSCSEAGGAGSTVIGRIYVNDVACTKCVAQRKFANNDYGNLPGTAVVTLVDGDKIYFTLTSTGTNTILCKYGNMNIHIL